MLRHAHQDKKEDLKENLRVFLRPHVPHRKQAGFNRFPQGVGIVMDSYGARLKRPASAGSGRNI